MGFPATWLHLREPADRLSRDAGLMRAAAEAAGPYPVVADLGCGTGATMRAMAPDMPPDAQWRLIDRDPDLLARIAPKAAVTRHEVDLADLNHLPLSGASLVTASALLDLMPADWAAELARQLGPCPFYAALTYDGTMEWQPPLAADADVTLAFNAHQRGDKGLGPAMGPDAPALTTRIFEAAGYDVQLAPSPWHLGPREADLQRALLEGIATAADEAGCEGTREWLAARISAIPEARCRIGHADLLARPRGAR
ncbi:MAG TPA: class I SAM-dependent methyltransferase [Paracoccus sp. (in: a-proteobacteria)]|uniref:class I SAM-dependent methyltransferase n=1 Tax=Paracoccus sp. TaxID=267 RepID=UPI002C5060F4|nr:class I SAM-dependent methyltransferase [Paracoccus sp. (in: a-proteobacteria)]HWL58637.1 class I SAM-dependent methyltransferase [Paracoccus sp. (in: a-proteobacteria)]